MWCSWLLLEGVLIVGVIWADADGQQVVRYGAVSGVGLTDMKQLARRYPALWRVPDAAPVTGIFVH